MGGALEARQVDASNGKLIAEASGEVEVEDGVLVLRRIKVSYQLCAPRESHEIASRAHAFHKRFCPVYRSIEGSIEISTELSFITEP